MKCLDLYSGFGGASEAFHQSDVWHVMRIENNPALEHVPNTTITDARGLLPDIYTYEWDLVIAAPPCTDFSQGFNGPGPTAKRNGIDFKPDMTDVLNSIRIIKALEPRYWLIENVVGAIKHFKPHLGDPRQIVGPFVLWGNFPPLSVRDIKHTKASQDVWSSDPLRSNKKACWPLELSQALFDAVMGQRQLTEWVSIGNSRVFRTTTGESAGFSNWD
jgi:hypothetical protein